MGRPKDRESAQGLLPRMEARPHKDGVTITYRYHPVGSKPMNLGTDKLAALQQVLSMTGQAPGHGTMTWLWEQWQTGKTTMALGALERLQRQGVPAAYVLPTLDWARDARRRTEVLCVDWRQAVNEPSREWRAVAVEDDGALPLDLWWWGIGRLRDVLGAHVGPTQLILVGERQRPANAQSPTC